MLFRKEAVDYRNRRWEGKAVLIPPLSPPLVYGFCALFFLCMLGLLLFGTYTRRVSAYGELVSVPRAITLFSVEQGFIVRLNVTPGQSVSKGQALAELNVSRTTISGGVSERQRETIKSQITTLAHIISRLKENRKITLDTLNAEKKRYEEALQHSTDIVNQARQGLALMKKGMDSYRDYQRRGLINQDQLTNQTALYYQQQNNLLSLITQNEQNALQIMTLEGNIRTQASDFDNQIYQTEIQRSDLIRQYTDVEAAGSQVVTAPAAGKIDSVSTAEGQITRPGDALMQLIPGNVTRYELVIWVPDSAVPFLHAGENVNIRYDAFPSEKFGLFPGHIISVGTTPATPQEMSTYPSAPGYEPLNPRTWYRVIVLPDSAHFSWQGKIIPAENGMKASTILYLEKRRLYEWALSPFYDLKDTTRGPDDEQK
ncbi:HlyD family secretion protein (plasmid) [Pantoea agglomerans]|uniref:HlyD family secretion protein n=1 Tax=Enterobacter agglomerans TaxID=549 RepID=UPI001F40E82F|nr:HlyD family secretion protein [Pantoea agglomerans]UJQ25801.1 HlyD family secretion protein [Pantoea agglomerans]